MTDQVEDRAASTVPGSVSVVPLPGFDSSMSMASRQLSLDSTVDQVINLDRVLDQDMNPEVAQEPSSLGPRRKDPAPPPLAPFAVGFSSSGTGQEVEALETPLVSVLTAKVGPGAARSPFGGLAQTLPHLAYPEGESNIMMHETEHFLLEEREICSTKHNNASGTTI